MTAVAVPARIADEEMQRLLEAIYETYHYDFRGYASASLKRRANLALIRLGCQTVPLLQQRMLRDPAAFAVLLSYLTVPVTEMFRDPEHFRALRQRVVPVLRTYPSLKIWIAGCSTGEEAYSVAIMLREAELLERSLIYATDINAQSLQEASAGVYGADRIAAYADSHRRSGATASLSDYYTAAYGRAVFDQGLRRHIVFADHSLATDSVFAEVQLVLCRNVLIYFDRALQDRAIGLFREALCRRGFLALGLRESMRFSRHCGAFEEIDGTARIYRRRDPS
jgi:chemotaxis protein methyltransferase CheR